MIRVFDRYLVALLGLVALAGLVVGRASVQPFHQTADPSATPGVRLPTNLGRWYPVHGVPEEMLPHDVRALASIRLTYSDGLQTVWLSIARYPELNAPEARPAISRIAPELGSASIERDRLSLPVNGHPGAGTVVNRLGIRRPQTTLSVLYWYQLADRVITSEYELRLRLLVNRLRRRPQPLMLVRVASESPEAAKALAGVIQPYLGRKS